MPTGLNCLKTLALYKVRSRYVEKTDIEKVMAENGFYVTHPKGTSMLPLIRQGHATAVIVPKEKLEKYDVALYKRKNGTYVLHRVVKIKNGAYVFCGDNQCFYEYGITHDMVIGVMKELWHDGVQTDISSKEYRKKIKKHVRNIPIRRIKSAIIRRIKKLFNV